MSMLRQLKDLWGYQDRIKQLEACNLELARRADYLKGERNKARGERDQLKAERDAVVRQAEAAEQAALKINAKLLGDIDQLKSERNAAAAERNMEAAERDKAIAERDATAKLLEETTASLVDARRRHGKLNEEFDRLAGMFRKKIDDLAAAEELLDEAGESIRIWRKVAFEMVAKLVVEKHCR